MSLHADVAVPARDRRRLERLCRYVARPPLALDRLEELPDRRLAYRLKTPWRDGTTHVVMERHELLERLAPLIPPPRAHQVRYHGVLAPCASGRDRIVPSQDAKEPFLHAVKDDPSPLAAHPTTWIDGANNGLDDRLGHGDENVLPVASEVPRLGSVDPSPVSPDARARLQVIVAHVGPPPRRRMAWADLLQRVFEVDALRCPDCGDRMRVLSAITDPAVAARILECVGMPSRAPPLGVVAHSSREPFEDLTLEFSQDDDPGFDFDQSVVENGSGARVSRGDSDRAVLRRSRNCDGSARVGDGNPAGDQAAPAARTLGKLEIAPERERWGLLVRTPSIGGAENGAYSSYSHNGLASPFTRRIKSFIASSSSLLMRPRRSA
jgi:hypothetical protein